MARVSTLKRIYNVGKLSKTDRLSFEFKSADEADRKRLNSHAQVAAYELTKLINRWSDRGMDDRAIYSILAMYHEYYGRLGVKERGESYMLALESEAHKLAQALIQKQENDRRKFSET